MNSPSHLPIASEQVAWNQAYDRLCDYLHTFALGDHAQVSRLALKILDEAREHYRYDSAVDPVTLTMARTHKMEEEWFTTNLSMHNQPPSQIQAAGCIALLLSRANQNAPATFLTAPLPGELRESIQQKLLVTGPDLKISSMTPRRLDYGPMLNLARETWHRWTSREIIIALLFWAAVYFIFYWWLSDAL